MKEGQEYANKNHNSATEEQKRSVVAVWRTDYGLTGEQRVRLLRLLFSHRASDEGMLQGSDGPSDDDVSCAPAVVAATPGLADR